LPDVDWKASDQTLVLVLSTTCHFCTESTPFYKQVIQKRKGRTRLIAVLPQSVEAGRKYLADLGIAVDDVRQAPPSSLGVQGTPTLLLVNKDGVITSSWRGKLRPEKELEVIAKL
jgi:thioredoxin-related protein